MPNRALLLISTALLIGVAGCARKKADLPPPLPSSTTPVTPTTPQTDGGAVTPGDVGTSQIPGSVADFIATSGSDRVRFALDSYDLDDEGRGVLGRQAEWLARYAQVRITVEGHADERGTREYNLALGERRANAAKNFLAAQGVAPGRIATISYGKERPEADGADEAAWAINRRAVTVILSGAAG